MNSARSSIVAAVCAAALAQPAAGIASDQIAWQPESPYAVHSMVYSVSPYGFKRAMFAEAAASGASGIRLDIVVGSIFAAGADSPSWQQVDEIVALSREFRVRVTAVVLDTPWWMADCPPDTAFERLGACPPRSPREFADLIGQIAAHTRGTIDTFEVLNEPDGRWAYTGTESDYAWTLSHTHDAITRANPRARVLIGGIMGVYSLPWLERVFAVPGADAARKFDIANVHLRGSLAGLERDLRTWRRFLARHGIRKPTWVTEHGYPSDPEFQTDPRYRGGERSQAEYLVESTRVLLEGGADRVFVTLRDNLDKEFASEGIVGGTVLDPPVENPQVRRKPAFDAFRRMAGARGPDRRGARRAAARYGRRR